MDFSQAMMSTLLVLNQILNAGNAITAFSLLLYALTFNLRERVARALALVLLCVAATYFFDVLGGTTDDPHEVELWLRLQWLGISFLPAAYLQLSDALMAATGRPSRGRRRLAVRIAYVVAGAGALVAALSDELAGPLAQADAAAYLQPGRLFPLFLLYFTFTLGFAALNYGRAYRRCLTRTSRRRMAYLMLGSLGPVLGTFPFLMALGNTPLARASLLFWFTLTAVNTLVAILLVMMAYAVAYFGVGIPDRVIKSRLFQWLLRGPVVASSTLAVTVVVNRVGLLLGLERSRAVPFAMVTTILLLQYVITLIRPPIERWLFYGEDREDMARLHLLEERLLTTGDLKQFLEAVLNAVCDITEAPSAFVAALGDQGLELEVSVGPDDPLRGGEELPPLLVTDEKLNVDALGTLFAWDAYWLLPLRSPDSD